MRTSDPSPHRLQDREHITIIPLTVREILDETIAHRLA